MRAIKCHTWVQFAVDTVLKSALLGTVVAAAIGTPVEADLVLCEDPAFSVDTADTSTRDMICAAASEARKALEECGLSQTQQVLIEVVESPIHNIGECLAAYDCSKRRIQIIDPDFLPGFLKPGDAYAALPDDVVFRSLLTHEMAHALVHQSSGERKITLVDHEYIANALELAVMPPEHRKAILDTVEIEPPVSSEVIDIFIYGLAPRRFAAAAYLYFEEHGCETVTDIIDGTASFHIDR